MEANVRSRFPAAPRKPARWLLALWVAATGVCTGTPPSWASGDWPRWRGTTFDGTGHGAEIPAGPIRLEVRWRRSLGSGYSGVVVGAGRTVTMFSDGEMDQLVSLDADTGEIHWQVAIAPTYPGREGANDGPVSTPAIEDGIVYALGPRGDLLAVGLATGDVVWRVHLVRDFGASLPHWGFGGSPLVVGERLIVPAGGQAGTILALDRRTGRRLWQAGSDDASYQSPMLLRVGKSELILAAGDQLLFAVDPSTGAERFRMAHGGEGFYRRILNPVRVDAGGLLLTYRPDESRLIRLHASGAELRAVDAWRSSHLKLNYATPVHHRGHLYGYSGDFLASIDARSGSLNWKSRAPGNGFPIVIDGNLVVLTKKGTLHVIGASPAAYRERARLDLFTRLAWTPPSFAQGRIFARDSFADLACIDVVRSDAAAAAEGGESVRGTIPDSRFDRFVRSVQGAADGRERVARFLAEQPGFPLVEDGRFVHLIYHGPAEDLVVRGDMLESGDAQPLRRVDDTDLHYFSFELDRDARINYQFVRDLEEVVPDPRNPRQAESLVYPGRVSQLLMPEAVGLPGVGTQVRHGRLEGFELRSERISVGSKTWGGERQVQVYLPEGHGEGNRRYPTLYVLHGRRMIDAGLAAMLDERIGDDLPPMIAVFVESISPYEYARSQRHAHRRMLVEQLVPRIDATYRTSPEAAHRMILGADEGGVSALELGLREPGVFGVVIAQSVFPVGAGDRELLQLVADVPVGSQRIWLDWGRYDQRMPVRRIDVPAFSHRLRDRLAERGFRITAREWNDGSDLLFWAWRAVDAMQHLLGPESLPGRVGSTGDALP